MKILATNPSRKSTSAANPTLLLNADSFGLAALDDGEQEQVTELLRTLRLEAGDFAASVPFAAIVNCETEPP